MDGSLAGDVRRGIAERGWTQTERPLTEEEFDALCLELGEIMWNTTVRVVGAEQPGVTGAQGMRFHNDCFSTNIIGWWCKNPGRPGEATRFFDARVLQRVLAPEDVEVLGTIIIDHPQYPAGYQRRPLLVVLDGELLYNFVPWKLVLESDGQRAAIERFNAAIGAHPEAMFSVQSTAGQCLFVDNLRFFHRRNPLAPNSPRFLKRACIRTDEPIARALAPKPGDP